MADVERITPPVPTLPSPVGRGVGSRQRRAPQRQPSPKPGRDEPGAPRKPDTEHIDEYV